MRNNHILQSVHRAWPRAKATAEYWFGFTLESHTKSIFRAHVLLVRPTTELKFGFTNLTPPFHLFVVQRNNNIFI